MMTTWMPATEGTGFGVDHLPYGVVSLAGSAPRPAVRIGGHALPLPNLAAHRLLDGAADPALFDAPTLNPFLAAGPRVWAAVRARLTALLADADHQPVVEPLLVPLDDTAAHLPFDVADYVDFYASEHHATNVGRMFRPDAPPLLPNWKHLPVGYHGRAGTVVVSGTDVVRPCGQRRAPDADAPTYGPSARLDIEAEVGFVVGVPSPLGARVATADFAAHVFGVVLVNDWSARDIQAWEYVPLGPFLGKSFATSVAAWVTPLAALEPARVAGPPQDPPVLPYLAVDQPAGYDIDLEVRWNGEVVARPPFRTMYWSPAQQLAHLTVNGASLRTGDLFASGTVSGERRVERGSFLELSWNGTEPVTFADGSTRTFLADGDEVVLTATAPGAGGPLRLGEVTGRVVPGHP